MFFGLYITSYPSCCTMGTDATVGGGKGLMSIAPPGSSRRIAPAKTQLRGTNPISAGPENMPVVALAHTLGGNARTVAAHAEDKFATV